MDTLEVPLLALLLQLVGDVVFLVSRLLTVSVSFLSVVVKNGNEAHRVLDEFLIFFTAFTQEVPARAVDDADVPV